MLPYNMALKYKEILDQYRKLRKIGEPRFIPAKFIHPDSSQPRKAFWTDPVPKYAISELRELASSIKIQGLINPILVSVEYKDEEKDEIYYKIVDGERRFRATTETKFGGLGEDKI